VVTEIHGGRCRIGVGGRVLELDRFPNSSQEAELALRIQKTAGGPERITLFDDLGIYKILATAGDTSAMERFVTEWLGPLIDYDAEHGTPLVLTLSEYLDRGGSYDASAKAAQALGVDVLALGVREPDDFNEAFSVMDSERPDAILMVSDSLTSLNRKRVFEYAAKNRLPAIYEYDPLVREGGLMSYGPDLRESLERAAAMVDRILKGAQPGDLPFEQPTRYLFLINLKTAKSIGLEIPPTLLALADEVIE